MNKCKVKLYYAMCLCFWFIAGGLGKSLVFDLRTAMSTPINGHLIINHLNEIAYYSGGELLTKARCFDKGERFIEEKKLGKIIDKSSWVYVNCTQNIAIFEDNKYCYEFVSTSDGTTINAYIK